MRTLLFVSLLALAAACATQQAESKSSLGKTATACITVDGSQEPVACNKFQSSITGGTDEGFCTCPTPARQVKAEFCVKGEPIPAETAAYRAAVKEASKDGSLIGDRFDGRRMCIAPTTT